MTFSTLRSRTLALAASSSAVLALGGIAVAAPVTYAVDPVHSAVLFRVKHTDIGYVHGRFGEFSGNVTVDDENLANAKVAMEVKATSVDTGNEKRDNHLRSPEFFGVAQFPTVSFASTSVEKAEGGYRVQGSLTLHGATKPLTVEIKKVGEGKGMTGDRRVGFEGSFTIKRSDFGMDKLQNLVGDEITMTVAFEVSAK